MQVKAQPLQLLVLRSLLHITYKQKPSRQELFSCAAATTQAHRSYSYKLWDGSIGECQIWHSLKRFASVGGACVPSELQAFVRDWVALRVAEPLTGWGHKVDPLVVREESAQPAKGTPKGNTVVKAEGKPAKPRTKPTSKVWPANPTPLVSAPMQTPPPIHVPYRKPCGAFLMAWCAHWGKCANHIGRFFAFWHA